MKYTAEITLDRPIGEVVSKFDDPANLGKWMEGLLSFEPISGTPGQPGAKSRLRFKMGKRDLEMIETILVRNLPDEFTGTYDAIGVHNIAKNRFESLSPTRTRYITEQEFHFRGFMKLIALLMPGSFRKQTEKHLIAFKRFVESS